MTPPDFSQHVPAIEDGVRLIKAGIYINLAKRFMSAHSEDDAAKLAFCVTSGLFLMPLEQEKYSTFADAHSDLIETECMQVAADADLAEAASYVYAILIMLTAWQTHDIEVGMSLTERATDLGFVIPNIVQIWGSRAIIAFHEFAEAFALRHAEVNTPPAKPDLSLKWQIDQPILDRNNKWTIIARAARINGEEVFALGFVPCHDADLPTATVSFHQATATTWLRMLYSAFTALENTQSYIEQIGLGRTPQGGCPPSSAIVGSVRDYGAIQIFVDWSATPKYAELSVYPPEGPTARITLGIHEVADLARLTTEAFTELAWDIPD